MDLEWLNRSTTHISPVISLRMVWIPSGSGRYTFSTFSLHVCSLTHHSQMKRMEYPTIFRMAMDYLPIQASAVPCERVFSSSAETDTKKRNRISPSLMETLQMLKFHLKKEHLNFTHGWVTSQKLLLEDEPDEPATSDRPVQLDPLDFILSTIMQEEGDGIVDAVELVELNF